MKIYDENIYMRKQQRNYSIVSNAYDIHHSSFESLIFFLYSSINGLAEIDWCFQNDLKYAIDSAKLIEE